MQIQSWAVCVLFTPNTRLKFILFSLRWFVISLVFYAGDLQLPTLTAPQHLINFCFSPYSSSHVSNTDMYSAEKTYLTQFTVALMKEVFFFFSVWLSTAFYCMALRSKVHTVASNHLTAQPSPSSLKFVFWTLNRETENSNAIHSCSELTLWLLAARQCLGWMCCCMHSAVVLVAAVGIFAVFIIPYLSDMQQTAKVKWTAEQLMARVEWLGSGTDANKEAAVNNLAG